MAMCRDNRNSTKQKLIRFHLNPRFFTRAFLLAGIFGLLLIFSLISRTTPWADEWDMVLMEPKTFIERLRWLFSQHNDHVILVQRILQAIIIKASGYDFRALILPNLFAIVGSTWLMLLLAEEFRGRSSFSDIMIILALCCVWPNAVTWSSTFAFPATNFLVAAFALIWMRKTVSRVSGSPLDPLQVVATLLLCAGPFIAAGGAVATTVFCMCLWFLRLYRNDVALPVPLSGLVAATIVNVSTWVAFRPSDSSGINFERLPDFILGLAGSSIYWLGLPGATLKNIACLLIILFAGIYSCWILCDKSQTFTSSKIVLASTTITVLAIGLSIAIGRSSFTGWYPGLEFHYGISTAMLIPLCILLLGEHLRLMRWVKVAFIILFGLSYVVAFQRQAAHLNSVRPSHLEALHRLAHSTNLSLTISDHFLDYTWQEDDNKENNAARFAKKVEFIRSHGGIQYLPWNQKQAFRK